MDASSHLQLTQESSILTTFSTTMNRTQRSGLHVREFLNSRDINDFVLPKHAMNMTDEFGKLQSHHALAPHLTTQWTDLNTRAIQTNETSDLLSPALHSHFEQSLL